MATDTIIKIGLYDVTAKGDATVSANDKQSFVNLDELKNEIHTVHKYATLEKDRFLLDDTYNLFPDDPDNTNMGYWSNTMSDQNGDLTLSPMLTFEFSMNHSSIGLTLDSVANGDFDFEAKITWYDGGNAILKQDTYTVKQGIHVIYEKVDNYRKITVEFLTTSKPYRWIKLDYIAFGVLLSYDGEEIVTAKISEEINPLSFVVPIDTLTFKLFSADKDFSLANPKGIYTALQQSQSVTVTGSVNNNTIQFGTYFLEDWQQENENVSKFTALDGMGILDKTEFKDGKMYVDTKVEIIVDQIMNSANWPNYKIDDNLKDVLLSGWLPISTHREAIQQVAFAIGATVKTNRDNFIEIFTPAETNPGVITKNQKFIGSKSNQKPFVTDINILSHNYVINGSDEEIHKVNLAAGTYEITFDQPYTNFNITNGTITKSSTNYVIINVTTPGVVTITGRGYTDNALRIIQSETNLPAGTIKNEIKVESAKLVNLYTAQTLAPKILKYFGNRRVDDFSFVVSDQKTSDYISLESIGGINLLGNIEKLDINLTGGYVTKARIVGKSEVV